MSKPKTSLFIFLVIVILIAIIALFGPEEKSLGSNVRIVYLHGAWVITAEIALLLAGASSAMALITRRQVFHRWSARHGIDHAPPGFSSLVGCIGAHRHFLLGHLSAAFTVGNASQLERPVPY